MFTKINDKIAAVHNFSMGRWGKRLTRKRLNDPSITDRVITQFIWQCPCCQRIINTVEKTSTGFTPAHLILHNSTQLSKQILRSQRVLYPPDTTNPSQQIALSDRALVEYDPAITEYPINCYVHFYTSCR